jgi:peptidyl-tRNA hydrolase
MKQVIVVNETLKLPRGKLAAQVAHASIAAFVEAADKAKRLWLEVGMPKVVLRVEHEADLIRLQKLAQARNIPAQLIADAGRTVIPEGTITCLGLGPAAEEEIDELTGDLKLL